MASTERPVSGRRLPCAQGLRRLQPTIWLHFHAAPSRFGHAKRPDYHVCNWTGPWCSTNNAHVLPIAWETGFETTRLNGTTTRRYAQGRQPTDMLLA